MMEASQNQQIFDFLSGLDTPKIETEKILGTIINLTWGSPFKFAESVSANSSDPGIAVYVLQALSGKLRTGPDAERIFDRLGIRNPWTERTKP